MPLLRFKPGDEIVAFTPGHDVYHLKLFVVRYAWLDKPIGYGIGLNDQDLQYLAPDQALTQDEAAKRMLVM